MIWGTHQNRKNSVGMLMLAAALLSMSGCMKGPGLMQQSGVAQQRNASTEPEKRVVTVRESYGASTGLVEPDNSTTQVVPAAQASSIAGSQAEFPPGSIAISTEITIAAAEPVATTATLAELQMQTDAVASAAPAVAISSSLEMDTTQPFTLALPLPDSSGLLLSDPYEKLAVMYKIKKVTGNGFFSGVIPRALIDISSGYARIQTTHFGTFQAVLLNEAVAAPIEVATNSGPDEPEPVPEPEPKPEPKFRSYYYVRGIAPATFGTDRSQADGYQGWLHSVVRASAGSKDKITKDYIVGKVKEE